MRMQFNVWKLNVDFSFNELRLTTESQTLVIPCTPLALIIIISIIDDPCHRAYVICLMELIITNVELILEVLNYLYF